MYGRLSSFVSKNDRSVINQITNYTKPSATQNVPSYQAYPSQYSYTQAPAYQSYAQNPPAPVYAPVNPPPQPYQAPGFDYYYRTGWEGYAHSLDQYSSYTVGEENKETLQPHQALTWIEFDL